MPPAAFWLFTSPSNVATSRDLQLRTVKELMEGKGIERPSDAAALDVTFKKAPESRKKAGHQKEFGL